MFGFGTNYFGSLVIAAGLVVTSQVPVPPSSTGSVAPYATHAIGTGVYGSGQVVTAQVPVPPVSSQGSVAPIGSHAWGTGVYGSGQVVTAQVPVPPVPAIYQPPLGGIGHKKHHPAIRIYEDEARRRAVIYDLIQEEIDEEDIALTVSLWLNIK